MPFLAGIDRDCVGGNARCSPHLYLRHRSLYTYVTSVDRLGWCPSTDEMTGTRCSAHTELGFCWDHSSCGHPATFENLLRSVGLSTVTPIKRPVVDDSISLDRLVHDTESLVALSQNRIRRERNGVDFPSATARGTEARCHPQIQQSEGVLKGSGKHSLPFSGLA